MRIGFYIYKKEVRGTSKGGRGLWRGLKEMMTAEFNERTDPDQTSFSGLALPTPFLNASTEFA